ncbi:MAG: MarR family transcriptional regulator [Thermoleophilia bacterium]
MADELEETVEALSDMYPELVRLVLARAERRRRASTPGERLGPEQMLTLMCIDDGALSVGEVAEATGVAISTATRMLQGLERGGLVERAPSVADRRRRLVQLTPEGQRVLHESGAARRRRVRALVAPLSLEERAVLLAGIRVFAGAMQADQEAHDPAAASGGDAPPATGA